MDFSYQQLLPQNFSNAAKVWIYQCNRIFNLREALQIEELLETFIATWKSHGTPVQGFGNLFFGQFIVLIADETNTNVSGCSTDSSVHFIKEVESIFKVNLMDRLNLAFIIKNKIEPLPMAQLQYAFVNKFITEKTIYFNNTIFTLSDLKTKWQLPIAESWLQNKLKIVI